MFHVEIIETTELGDRSYVVHDGATAVVIDSQRDIDRLEGLLEDQGLQVAAIAETHIHNDYVTGGFALAQATGADYLVSAHDHVSFERLPVADGDEFTYGNLALQVIATPGHTHHHLAFAISDSNEPEGRVAVFTGGSLLYGSVGRTDLLGAEHTDALTRAQFHSARKIASILPDDTDIYPTHGFGSFCSSGSAAGGDGSTVGEEKVRNDALTESDEDTFVERLLANLTAYPAYYAHMGARNLAGPNAPDLSLPTAVDSAELRARVAGGEWVVDLRNRTLYSAEHLAGTIGIELGQQFATYLGWLIPWDSPLTLIGETEADVASAQRQLVRIGIERPDGAAIGDISQLAASADLESYPRSSFAELKSRGSDDLVILDVRRDDERSTHEIPGSLHIPMHALLARLDEIPQAEVWVHCASGFRASIATSLLARAGHDVVLIDDDFTAAQGLGMTS